MGGSCSHSDERAPSSAPALAVQPQTRLSEASSRCPDYELVTPQHRPLYRPCPPQGMENPLIDSAQSFDDPAQQQQQQQQQPGPISVPVTVAVQFACGPEDQAVGSPAAVAEAVAKATGLPPPAVRPIEAFDAPLATAPARPMRQRERGIVHRFNISASAGGSAALAAELVVLQLRDRLSPLRRAGAPLHGVRVAAAACEPSPAAGTALQPVYLLWQPASNAHAVATAETQQALREAGYDPLPFCGLGYAPAAPGPGTVRLRLPDGACAAPEGLHVWASEESALAAAREAAAAGGCAHLLVPRALRLWAGVPDPPEETVELTVQRDPEDDGRIIAWSGLRLRGAAVAAVCRGSAADLAGAVPGMLVRCIEGCSVATAEDAERAADDTDGTEYVMIAQMPGGGGGVLLPSAAKPFVVGGGAVAPGQLYAPRDSGEELGWVLAPTPGSVADPAGPCQRPLSAGQEETSFSGSASCSGDTVSLPMLPSLQTKTITVDGLVVHVDDDDTSEDIAMRLAAILGPAAAVGELAGPDGARVPLDYDALHDGWAYRSNPRRHCRTGSGRPRQRSDGAASHATPGWVGPPTEGRTAEAQYSTWGQSGVSSPPPQGARAPSESTVYTAGAESSFADGGGYTSSSSSSSAPPSQPRWEALGCARP
eukprot:TRINITY_DN1358_c1_g1_i4.p1 TRINITY_DN1358_c1_g1~~TRINITY_DN1358_c1_g1_i4.p1  ORF type:complete len:688 (+),score=188.36 TRINITY_DN1358_c1_g1_i4:104-2065(+)